MSDKIICQVALCALNAANLRDWYQVAFGMVKAGKIFSVPPMSTDRIQGIAPNPVETVSWLVRHGVESHRLYSKGLGLERPIDSNYTSEGRQRNRRVEFHIVERDGEVVDSEGDE